MKGTVYVFLLSVILSFNMGNTASAHFQMIIPSDEIVAQSESKEIELDVMFIHPFEGHGMNMERPGSFGVFVRIEGDLEGLIYTGEIEKEVMDKLKPGDKIKAKIIKVDIEQAKIGLSAKL